MYRDTDLPGPDEDPPITDEQRAILYDWLINHSPFNEEKPLRPEGRRSQDQQLTYEDIVELLELSSEPASDCDWDSQETISANVTDQAAPKTSTCQGHKVQPECVVFERAIARMRQLSASDEKKLEKLLNNPEYMSMLEDRVKDFLERNS